MKGLPIRTPADLEDRPRHQQWLVDTLWGRQAVGLIGGEPKCGKSFLAFTVAVASGVPCLRHFPATPPGPALLRSTTKSHQIIRSHDHQLPRARSVDAYESAGGKVLHDLFARDDESGAWFEDPVLLDRRSPISARTSLPSPAGASPWTGPSATAQRPCSSRPSSKRRDAPAFPTEPWAASMSAPPRGAGATTGQKQFDEPKLDAWLRPLRKD